jgi:hypothetical protein
MVARATIATSTRTLTRRATSHRPSWVKGESSRPGKYMAIEAPVSFAALEDVVLPLSLVTRRRVDLVSVPGHGRRFPQSVIRRLLSGFEFVAIDC